MEAAPAPHDFHTSFENIDFVANDSRTVDSVSPLHDFHTSFGFEKIDPAAHVSRKIYSAKVDRIFRDSHTSFLAAKRVGRVFHDFHANFCFANTVDRFFRGSRSSFYSADSVDLAFHRGMSFGFATDFYRTCLDFRTRFEAATSICPVFHECRTNLCAGSRTSSCSVKICRVCRDFRTSFWLPKTYRAFHPRYFLGANLYGYFLRIGEAIEN